MSSQIPLHPPPSYEAAQQGQSQRPAPPRPGGAPPLSPRPGPKPLDIPALNLLRGRRVVLASASPRRRYLLAQIGITPEIIPSNFAEDLPKHMSPFEYVLETASEKAREVYKREIDNVEKGEPALLIAADTIIISHAGKTLEKPRNAADHFNMLKMLRDEGTHKVATAIAIMRPLDEANDPGYRMETHIEETTVKFDPNLTDDLILAYVKTSDGNDKAGGYGIQSAGSILIERIEGSYDNVVGLPLRALLTLIEKVMAPKEVDDDDEDTFNHVFASSYSDDDA
ncbi:Maf-like protein-domain-containing protein [Massariosphaeria phaeospora]|uniref:Maf-like protein-domain-containing protein n=1 Tax=Massariosphaeria phaeospora TaxID=100035 RepID=A0A7C8I1Y2_9PLEO|nr:Maf-like protein-domain-containing protein [Massariosphaeria phaeospora]